MSSLDGLLHRLSEAAPGAVHLIVLHSGTRCGTLLAQLTPVVARDLKPARLQSLAAQQYPADRLVARLSGHAFCDWLFPKGSSEGSTPPRVKIVLFSIQDKIAPVYAAVAGTLADAGVDFGVSEPNDAAIAQYFNLTKRYTGPFTFLTLAAWSMSLAARHSSTPDRLWQQGLYAEVAPKHVESTAALEAACLRGNASCVLVVTSSGSEEQDATLQSVLRRAGVILRLESAAAPSVALLAKDQARLAGPELQKLIDSKGSGPRVFFLDGRQGLAFEMDALSSTEFDERAALRSLLLELEAIQQGKRTPLLRLAQLDPGRDEL
ncbi:hypothetical protein QBZ16_005234 [Prototheca wickerhamii]|uniref:Uncharacterized protein n=1 Tax=Prototheca wickerhamii TaxID=3111 RepID=A0AAD9IG63_PROWI|nr:hypothetical protein QBZ16_005234 [Prototheca wickerhamii]